MATAVERSCLTCRHARKVSPAVAGLSRCLLSDLVGPVTSICGSFSPLSGRPVDQVIGKSVDGRPVLFGQEVSALAFDASLADLRQGPGGLGGGFENGTVQLHVPKRPKMADFAS